MLLQPFQFPFVPEEQLIPFIEILFEDDAYPLGGEVGLGIIPVVCLVIRFQAYVAGAVHKPIGFEVAHEIGVGHRVVAVAEVAVDEQSVVQQLSGEHRLELHIGPAFFSGTEICAEVPVVAVDDL